MTDTETLKHIFDNTTDLVNLVYHESYKVINSPDLPGLENQIISALIDDWRCLGGVAVAVNNGTVEFFQSMVK